MGRISVVFTVLFFPSLVFAQSADLFPQNISEENASVTFEVDSTWHLIEGVATEVAGRVWLEEPGDLHSIHADISFPVVSLDTDNSMRDERLREVMASEKFPNVRFQVAGVSKACDLAVLRMDTPCATRLNGTLTIRDVSRNMSIPLVVARRDEDFSISGKTSIQWADYGVEDPSILLAKLDKTVSISFEVILDDKASGDAK